MDALPFALLGVSIAVNAALAFTVYRLKKTDKKLDTTAQDLLHDLMRRGSAVVRVEVVDPAAILLRSPRL